jgi:hypothetical protein
VNDRFDELMYRAGITAQGCWDEMDGYDRDAILNFAELIVAECMSIAQEYDGSKLGGPGLIIAMRIEQHFGVEE